MASKKVFNIFSPESEKIKSSGISSKYRNSWFEDVFHFESKQGRQVPLPKTSSYMGTSLSDKKIIVLLLIILFFFLIVLGRIFYLQVIKGGEYYTLAEMNRQRIIPISSERGLIYDRQGIQLTKNVPKFSLALTPQDLPRDKEERENIVKKLAELTEQDVENIRQTLEEYGSYSYESIVIKENIDYETALSIQIASADLPGIHIQRGSKRLYIYNEDNNETPSSTLPDELKYEENSLSHVIGYEGKLNRVELDELYKKGYLPSDYIGKVGIEKIYEEVLRGKYGSRRTEVNSIGKEQSIIAEEPPEPGKHLYLSIDLEMQKKLEEIMIESLKKNDKKRAAGVVLDVNTGEVLALVSLPAFNNNHFSGGIDSNNYSYYIENPDRPLFNRALSGMYPSGSTIKPAMAAAALQEGIISKNTTFLSMGGIQVGDWFFPDWLAGGHGRTNVTKAIAWSVNTFFYYIGGGYNDFVGLGVDRITSYLKKFGFSEKLGIDLPGEAAGFLPSKEWKEQTKGERWYIGDTYNLSIGQGDILVTPLQIAAMTATFANGGTLYRPHIVTEIVDPTKGENYEQSPEIIRSKFIDSSYIQIVKQGMRDCVNYGSCRQLSLLPFASAGKTGTAQWSSEKENHAWFTSFAPYDNPEIAITVIVEEGGEGSEVSLPIVSDFYRWWWNRY